MKLIAVRAEDCALLATAHPGDGARRKKIRRILLEEQIPFAEHEQGEEVRFYILKKHYERAERELGYYTQKGWR